MLVNSVVAVLSCALGASAAAIPSPIDLIRRDHPLGTVITKCTKPGVLALAFDDGPYQYTQKLVDTLNAAGAKGTFFFTGTLYGQKVQVVTHPHVGNLGASQLQTELTRLEDAYVNIFGKKPAYLRPPYLETYGSVMNVARQMNYVVVTNDIDSGDWNNQSPQQSQQRFIQAGAGGNGHIPLMHETYDSTVSVLVPWLINWAKQNNLRLVTVVRMSTASQMFPPCPKFTDKDVPDQTGKVHIVTGGASGIGFELARILYQKNATVYIAARSEDRITSAIKTIQEKCQNSKGRLEAMALDLSDLTTIKPAVAKFMAKDERLDVLFHNAGVMATPVESKSAQGHELQMATNALGPFLLTKLLEPVLLHTAKHSSSGSTRIVWVASIMALGTPKGGIVWDTAAGQPSLLSDSFANYMQSKAGVIFLAHEYAKQLKKTGIISMIHAAHGEFGLAIFDGGAQFVTGAMEFSSGNTFGTTARNASHSRLGWYRYLIKANRFIVRMAQSGSRS
ncbi:hypothetical protein DL770_010530 [Monosporascus sp. CRB-9-2]|nr:hypothetical protein DL770_010530 [Monosporascus sp. CRB-9-2]